MKIYRKYFCILLLCSISLSQNNINNLSNKDLDSIIGQLKQKNSIEDVIKSDNKLEDSPEPKKVSISNIVQKSPDNYFGYNYFDKRINFFDNIPTPPDFILGPGDEIILSLWGEINSREKFTINKNGLIFYPNIGFINLSNKTLEEAESFLTKELSKIYSTLLKDTENQTELMLELGRIKSINVYFTGQVKNVGINLIHPFSDIFSALVQAGGINNNGSLRQVQLIRNGKIISTFDFYSFFIKGENIFSQTRIIDGDIIHVPTILNRVQISGQIKTPGFFELFNNESIIDLLRYSSGLTSNASSFARLDALLPMQERSSNDNAKMSKNISFENFANISLNDGDSVTILPIGDVETKVNIFGRVKLPGEYAAPSKLKTVLDLAGGFDDPLYRKTIRDDQILVLRKDENQFYSLEFKIPYTESASFNLVPGDNIFVYENSLYNNLFSVIVTGEVNKRGSFQLKEGMTVNDAIILAEGFTTLANQNAITITEDFTYVDNLGNEVQEKTQVKDATLEFEITNGSIINVLPMENVVNVQGNVYSPGLITYSKGKTVNKYINLAGGHKPNTLSNKIHVKRANGRIKKVTFFQGIGTLVRPGDTIVVPVDPEPNNFNITSFISDLASTLANIAAILIVVDNQSD